MDTTISWTVTTTGETASEVEDKVRVEVDKFLDGRKGKVRVDVRPDIVEHTYAEERIVTWECDVEVTLYHE